MEVYIEKEFLDNFYIDFEGRKGQVVLKSILTIYGDRRVFVNYDIEDYQKLKSENEFFALIGNTLPPIPVESIEKHLFDHSTFEQVLVFMNEKQEWYETARQKGSLCFCFKDYEKAIEGIIAQLHFRIDLSEGFKGWQFLERFRVIPLNNLIVTDGYVLSDKDNQKMKDNILPILNLLLDKRSENMQIDFITKELNPISASAEHIMEKAKKRHKLLIDTFTNHKAKFRIIMSGLINSFDFHDRTIQTNFSLTECGKGFNLSKSKPSNSQIISKTIFNKYTYYRLKNHCRMQKEYVNKLKELDTLKFKMYP